MFIVRTLTLVESREMNLEITGGREALVTQGTLDGFEPFVNCTSVDSEVPRGLEHFPTYQHHHHVHNLEVVGIQ